MSLKLGRDRYRERKDWLGIGREQLFACVQSISSIDFWSWIEWTGSHFAKKDLGCWAERKHPGDEVGVQSIARILLSWMASAC